jgi:predicted lipoprotein
VSTSAPISSIAASVPVPIPTASSDVPNTTPSSTPPSEYNLPFTKANLLTAISVCALESYREFKAHAEELELVSSEFAASPDGDHVQIARESWLTAVASWQRAEPFRFGPAARSSEPGGLNLRDQIYVFPLANYCKVDQQIVDQAYQSGSFGSSIASARGLSTVEYLLFNDSANNSCYPALTINASGAWAALGNEIWTRRADYAARTAEDVAALASTLVEAWDEDEGNFSAELSSAGQGSNTFASSQKAFNAISDGMFYIEKEVKDWKLGWPLGLVPDCINAPDACPTEVESRYARRSLDHIRQNLVGFRRLFEGCGPDYAGLGYDDWLTAIGDEDLATRMRDALIAAQITVESVEPSLETALVTDVARARQLHTAVKALTDLLKTEFVTVLNLELPKGAEGDND